MFISCDTSIRSPACAITLGSGHSHSNPSRQRCNLFFVPFILLFYSQRNQLSSKGLPLTAHSLAQLPPYCSTRSTLKGFLVFLYSLQEVHKTGLGSSAVSAIFICVIGYDYFSDCCLVGIFVLIPSFRSFLFSSRLYPSCPSISTILSLLCTRKGKSLLYSMIDRFWI